MSEVEEFKKLFYKKTNLIGPNRRMNASAVLARLIARLSEQGLLTQMGDDRPSYHLPSGRAYTGSKLDRDGYCYTYWYSTYDGCRDYWIVGDVLRIRIWNGEMLGGEPTTVRGTWDFKIHDAAFEDATFRRELSDSIAQQWSMFLLRKRDEELEAIEKKALLDLEKRLLSDDPDPA